MQDNNKLFEVIQKQGLPSNDIGNVGDIYLQIFDEKEKQDYRQDDAYIYANKSGDSELIGLLIVLIILMIGFIILK